MARRGFLLVAGLRAHGDLEDSLVQAAAILRWLADCWAALTAELADQTSAQSRPNTFSSR